MDFNEFMSCCSANYVRLNKLLRSPYSVGDVICLPVTKWAVFEMRVTQKQHYTETLCIRFGANSLTSWLPYLQLEVKMYHDANLVEVTACQDPLGKMQSFSHATSHKFFPYWEKWQLNKFLSEMLSSSLNQNRLDFSPPKR